MSRYRTDSVVQDREMRESAGLDPCPRVVLLGRIVNLNYIVQKIPRQRADCSTRHALSGVGRAVRQTTQSNCPELSRAGPDWQEAESFLPVSFQLAIRRWGIVKLLTLFGGCEDWSLWRLRSRYKGYRYPIEVIGHAVWLYHRFALSLRDVEELMLARGVVVTYETIRSWCAKFGPDYAAQ